MADQVQCPNCGGYKITQSVETIYASPTRGTMRPSKARRPNLLAWAFVLFVVGALLWFGIRDPIETSVVKLIAFVSLFIGFYGTILIIAWRMIAWMRAQFSRELVGAVYDYECHLCGYRWSWQTGTQK